MKRFRCKTNGSTLFLSMLGWATMSLYAQEHHPVLTPTHGFSVINMLGPEGEGGLAFGAPAPDGMKPSRIDSLMLSKTIVPTNTLTWVTHPDDATSVDKVALKEIHYGFIDDRLVMVAMELPRIKSDSVADARALFLRMDRTWTPKMISHEAYAYAGPEVEVITFGMCLMYEVPMHILLLPSDGPIKSLPAAKPSPFMDRIKLREQAIERFKLDAASPIE